MTDDPLPTLEQTLELAEDFAAVSASLIEQCRKLAEHVDARDQKLREYAQAIAAAATLFKRIADGRMAWGDVEPETNEWLENPIVQRAVSEAE